jgi:hypothetical protein
MLFKKFTNLSVLPTFYKIAVKIKIDEDIQQMKKQSYSPHNGSKIIFPIAEIDSSFAENIAVK